VARDHREQSVEVAVQYFRQDLGPFRAGRSQPLGQPCETGNVGKEDRPGEAFLVETRLRRVLHPQAAGDAGGHVAEQVSPGFHALSRG